MINIFLAKILYRKNKLNEKLKILININVFLIIDKKEKILDY